MNSKQMFKQHYQPEPEKKAGGPLPVGLDDFTACDVVLVIAALAIACLAIFAMRSNACYHSELFCSFASPELGEWLNTALFGK